MPMCFADGSMLPVTLYGLENKTLAETHEAVRDVLRRTKNTNLNEAMYEVSIDETMRELKRGRVLCAAGRLAGFWLDGGPKTLLHGAQQRAYRRVPETERLTARDLRPGTITITNPGSLYKEWRGVCTLLEIVPLQLCAIALGAVQKKPVVAEDGTIRAGEVLPLTLAFDHRALDAGDVMPFLQELDRIFAQIRDML